MTKVVYISTIPVTLHFFASHINYLKKNNVEVFVISSNSTELEIIEKQYGVKSFTIPFCRTVSPMKDMFIIFKMIRLFKKLKPDIIHPMTPKDNLLCAISSKFTDAITYISCQGLPQLTMKGLSKIFMNFITKFTFSLSDRVWTVSKSLEQYVLLNKLTKGDKIITLHNGSICGLDAVTLFNPSKLSGEFIIPKLIRAQEKHDLFIFGYIGRLSKDKGMHELSISWEKFSKSLDNVHLILIGDVDSRDPIDQSDLNRLLNNKRVHLVQHQPKENIPKILKLMDVFVMPSYREGFGLANLEASAMGLPVISTNILGCVDSVKHNQTGLLVKVKNEYELQEKMLFYYNNREIAKLHGSNGRKRVLKDFQPEDLSECLLNDYNLLLSKKNT